MANRPDAALSLGQDLRTIALLELAERRRDAADFAAAAQATRKLWESLGYRVHVQTNDRRVVVTKQEAEPNV